MKHRNVISTFLSSPGAGSALKKPRMLETVFESEKIKVTKYERHDINCKTWQIFQHILYVNK
jgi:hypothetical protein